MRYHAGRALLALHGVLDEEIPEHDREHMMYRVMSDDPARSAGGKRDILAAITGRPISAP